MKKIILVLGCKLNERNKITEELIGRLNCAIELFYKEKPYILFLSGGKTNKNSAISEVQIMKNYLLLKKIDIQQIIIEDKSLDTIGNAFFSRLKIDEILGDENLKIFVVSSCYHMKRVEYVFKYCFGNQFELNFDCCYSHKINEKIFRKENGSLKMAKHFFKNVEYGDIEEIRRRIFTIHDLYKK